MMGLRFRQTSLNEKTVGQVGQVGQLASMRVCRVPPRFCNGGTRWDTSAKFPAEHRGSGVCPTVSHLRFSVVGRSKPAWVLRVPLVPRVPPKKACTRISSLS